MTTIQVVKIMREKNSKWEKALELNIDQFDAINRIYDENGFEIDEFYDIKRPKNNELIDIPSFP
jgi:hypothetical protein